MYQQRIQTDLQQIRSMAEQMAQLEQANAQKLRQISQMCTQVSQEITRTTQFSHQQPQPPVGVQRQFQPQPQATVYPQGGTQQWVQRHTQAGFHPAATKGVISPSVPQHRPVQ
ncbi:hypothetical protein [Desmospora activa]|uniref:Uncharacterized protein n=1 Tax=Desmospora activa DSM 45169 TaxID=1121389 RepID=A0A2T4Z3Y3_9BACL|nr:hypothetical protein [Desmospora activa]PTM56601.1 hypothetical protein C8J48_2923 [Desmospora activa DSM 45169]